MTKGNRGQKSYAQNGREQRKTLSANLPSKVNLLTDGFPRREDAPCCWLSAGVSPLPRCRIVESPIILYRAVEPLLVGTTGLMRSPCGGCPVVKDCSESTGNAVNPVKCAYIKEWLTS